MENVKVSIIIPIYNAEKYLCQCIESVMNQTLKEIEIILINDSSKDSSEHICLELAKRDNRIKYYYKENEGLAAARQDGIERSSGEFIGFIDSDDWIEPDMYEKMYLAAETNNSDMVLCNCYENIDIKRPINLRPGSYNFEQIKKELFPHVLIGINSEGSRSNTRWSNCLRLYKKNIIDEKGVKFDRRFRRSQDLPFTFEFLIHSRNFYFIEEYLYHNRQEPGSLSRGYTKNMWQLIKPLIIHLYNLVENYNEYDFSELVNSTAYFLSMDCILNEFKDDSPNKREKVKHIKDIISDPVCFNSLDRFNYKKLNNIYLKIFYTNMKNQNAKKLVHDYYYNRGFLKNKIVGPITNLLTENKLYKIIRKK